MSRIKNKIANKRIKKDAEARVEVFRDLKAEMQQLMEEEDYVTAMDVMAEIAANKKIDTDVMYWGAMCYFRTGDYDRAAKWIDNVLTYDDSSRAKILLAAICVGEGIKEDGLRIADAVLADGGNTAEDHDNEFLQEVLEPLRYGHENLLAKYPKIREYLAAHDDIQTALEAAAGAPVVEQTAETGEKNAVTALARLRQLLEKSKREAGDSQAVVYADDGQANDETDVAELAEEAQAAQPGEAVTFSHSAGSYTEPFVLQMETSDEDAIILYTLDGSEPNTGSLLYTKGVPIRDLTGMPNRYVSVLSSTESLGSDTREFVWTDEAGNTSVSAAHMLQYLQPRLEPVSKAVTVRARTCKDGKLGETITTATYFVNSEQGFPRVSITTDPELLFNSQNGLLVPGGLHWTAAALGAAQSQNIAKAHSAAPCGFPAMPPGWKNKKAFCSRMKPARASSCGRSTIIMWCIIRIWMLSGKTISRSSRSVRWKTALWICISTANTGAFIPCRTP